MAAPTHSSAIQATTQMPQPAQPQTRTEPSGDTPAVAAPGSLTPARMGRRAMEQFADNPLQALFGTAIVALLIFSFNSMGGRIDSVEARIDDTNDRITRLEDRVTRLEEKMDARFTALEEDVAEINLKLTALIAALNQTAAVDAALEGTLTGSAETPVDAAPG